MSTESSEKRRLLEAHANDMKSLNGDIAVMHQLILQIEKTGVGFDALRNELLKLKQRIVWDDFATEFSVARAFDQYGPRP